MNTCEGYGWHSSTRLRSPHQIGVEWSDSPLVRCLSLWGESPQLSLGKVLETTDAVDVTNVPEGNEPPVRRSSRLCGVAEDNVWAQDRVTVDEQYDV